jgi:hypothetical protein
MASCDVLLRFHVMVRIPHFEGVLVLLQHHQQYPSQLCLMGGLGMHGFNVAVAVLVRNVITESVSNDNTCGTSTAEF